jgi:hypothetical protein
MERALVFENFERATLDDFNNIHAWMRTSLDHIVKDIGIPDKGFVGFNAVATGPAQVTLGEGRLYDQGAVYYNDDAGGFVVDLLARLPVVTNAWATIVAYGNQVNTNLQPRTFLTDVATRAVTARDTTTESRRRAEISVVVGIEGPDPTLPVVPANTLPLAHVLLSPAGIVRITVPDSNRAPSVRDNATRLDENDAWRLRIGSKIDTLGSDISALANQLRGVAPWTFVRMLTADVARLKEKAHLPSAYTAFAAAHFLTPADTETGHVDNLARIEEGIRFPPVNTTDAQIGLLNPFDPRAITQNFFVLPTYTEASRLSVVGNDGEKAISTYQFQTQTITERTRSVSRLRYGTPFTVCTNSAFWQTGVFDYANWTFYSGTGVYNLVGEATLGDATPNGLLAHGLVRLQQVWQDTTSEAYWDLNTVTSSASGSIMAQTFLNTQDGWLTSVDLYFTRIAAGADVQVLITETSAGAPELAQVVGRATLHPADMKAYPTKTNVPFAPTLLQKGKRYALVLITPGNHYVSIVTDNKFAQGSLFYSTDGAWFLGDLTNDLAFGLNFAKFDNPRVELQLNPLQLAGGIAAIDLQAPMTRPPGTDIVFRVQDPANGQWLAINGTDGGAILNGLPPLVQFQAVLIGTTDVMPGFGVGSNSRVTTWRPRTDFKHISKVRTMPSAVTHVTVDIRLEAWRGVGFHTHTCRLLTGPLLLTGVGDTLVNPSTTVDEVALDDPTGATIIRHYTFVIPAATTFRIRQDGTTTNALSTYHVAERVDIETP